MARARVFIACSLDGFIAGEDDDLSWLPGPEPGDAPGDATEPPSDHGFGAFLADVGALLMGRNTYRVVEGFDGEWFYGDRPVLVATHRPLTPKMPTVRAVSGPIDAMLAEAFAAADGKDVYVDGGDLIRQALERGLIDELIVSVIPVVLGRGAPLFAGVDGRHFLDLVRCERQPGGMVQLTYRPRGRRASSAA
ncbi:MAG: dihydrofolate reductase [Deltaproteobacteria bacterium]|nr:MAG: dihydrofolate reductase [Deltaproteobacteria bacterium]